MMGARGIDHAVAIDGAEVSLDPVMAKPALRTLKGPGDTTPASRSPSSVFASRKNSRIRRVSKHTRPPGRGVAPGVYTKIRDFKGDSVSKGV
jgi:hypothetical protein